MARLIYAEAPRPAFARIGSAALWTAVLLEPNTVVSKAIWNIGAGLPGARSLDIARAYVRAFSDQHLRGSPQALLDQPSPRYPEVTFCFPTMGVSLS